MRLVTISDTWGPTYLSLFCDRGCLLESNGKKRDYTYRVVQYKGWGCFVGSPKSINRSVNYP